MTQIEPTTAEEKRGMEALKTLLRGAVQSERDAILIMLREWTLPKAANITMWDDITTRQQIFSQIYFYLLGKDAVEGVML